MRVTETEAFEKKAQALGVTPIERTAIALVVQNDPGCGEPSRVLPAMFTFGFGRFSVSYLTWDSSVAYLIDIQDTSRSQAVSDPKFNQVKKFLLRQAIIEAAKQAGKWLLDYFGMH